MLKETHIDDVIDELYIDSFGHKGDNEIKILIPHTRPISVAPLDNSRLLPK